MVHVVGLVVIANARHAENGQLVWNSSRRAWAAGVSSDNKTVKSREKKNAQMHMRKDVPACLSIKAIGNGSIDALHTMSRRRCRSGRVHAAHVQLQRRVQFSIRGEIIAMTGLTASV